ncbi:MAG: hypothetical protein GX641_03765, partial [Mollicutes bacterium]|nr:hypothetical protein [Mollicutes bacterium]
IFNILTITGMVFNIGTSKEQEPNINIEQAPIVEKLKLNHTYKFTPPTGDEATTLQTLIKNNQNYWYVEFEENNYIGVNGNTENVIEEMLYIADNIYNITGVAYDEIGITQFTITHDTTIYSFNIDLLPYLTDITQGGQIIGSIASGLGLIGNLTNEFLTGFTYLFWQNESLTSFGGFALVMLGVSVSFAVVKLVLFIIRNKSGS